MKKLDKLILSSFLGLFFLIFIVSVFIFFNQNMLGSYKHILGKDVDVGTLVLLCSYIIVFISPMGLHLTIMISSLMVFGNLSESLELTALKSLGISLTRVLLPIFLFMILVTGGAFILNNYLVPRAALEAFSLLYDIKQKKPTLDLKERLFYTEIPGISIRAEKKFPDGKSLKNVIIYDERNQRGNKKVIKADSGRLETILGGKFLRLNLFNGYDYLEDNQAQIVNDTKPDATDYMSRTHFSKSQIMFDLSSFMLNRTDKKWFQKHTLMRNVTQLDADMDSTYDRQLAQQMETYNYLRINMLKYAFKQDTLSLPKTLAMYQRKKDSLQNASNDTSTPQQERGYSHMLPIVSALGKENMITTKPISTKISHLFSRDMSEYEIDVAIRSLTEIQNNLNHHLTLINGHNREYNIYHGQWHKIFSHSFACIIMFLIGAPLGALIKRGGLGIPVLVSIFFFIVFFVLNMMGEKWARAHTTPYMESISMVPFAAWFSSLLLLVLGLFFMRKAYLDARLFEFDPYFLLFRRIKKTIAPNR